MMINPYSRRLFRLWLALGQCALLGVAQAQKKPSSTAALVPQEEPSTMILSDTLHFDDTKRESTFAGNVVMTRGFMTMNADALKLREDAEGFQYGTGTVKPGKRVFIRQVRPEVYEVLEGVGVRAEYDGKSETFDLIGQAVVTRYICGQHFDTVSGERVRYSQKTDVYEAFSGPDSANSGGRVRSVAQPRSRADAAVAECKAKEAGLPVATPIPTPAKPASTEPAANTRRPPAPAVRP
jgi:lipopolysaccharide export system protein LptA